MSDLFTTMFSQSDFKLDLAAYKLWQKALNDTPDFAIQHSKHCMSVALKEELTLKQKQYLMSYYADGLSMPEIAEHWGVNKATVSRTIMRAERRLFRAVRYSNPAFLKLPMPKIRHGLVSLGMRQGWKEKQRLANDSYLRED